MRKVLHVKTIDTPFIQIDEQILKNNFEVISYHFEQTGNPFKTLINCLKLIKFLFSNINSFEVIFIMFVDYFTPILGIFSKMFKKKFIVAVGGYDAVSFPDFELGVFSSRLKAKCATITYRCADYILPNHETLEYGINTYIDNKIRYLGVKYFVPNLKAKFKIVYNGYYKDYAKEKLCNDKDDKMCLLVGRVSSIADFYRKGHDLLIAEEKKMPQYDFYIVGLEGKILRYAKNMFKTDQVKNLKIIGSLKPAKLKKLFQKAKLIVQPSISEGMPNTLCEAMLHKCIPVGSNVNGIPLAIGDTGIVFEKRNSAQLTRAIEKAFSLNSGNSARRRILENFSFERRESEIARIIEEC